MGKEHQVLKNTRRGAIVDGRRVYISELLCRGHTQYRIWEELAADEQYYNPRTEQPWSLGTVQEDIRHIRQMWQEQVRLHYDIHVSRLLGQIRAVRKAAWKEERLDTVLKTLDQEVKLLGLDKATKVDMDWKQEMRKAGVDPSETFDDLVQSTYEKIMAASAMDE